MNNANKLHPDRIHSTKHEVMIYGKSEGVGKDVGRTKQWAGEAFYYPEGDYFQLQLAIFPFPYFLTRNRDSANCYTVWAQKVKDAVPVRFRRPVGRGVVTITKELNDTVESNCIEVEIPLFGLKSNPMVSLFPGSRCVQ